MNRKTVATALAMMIALQVTVLAGEYLGAVYPLWTVEEIKLKAVPVDPRSLFRGNYARLNFEISSIDAKALDGKKKPRAGDFVYIKLKPGAHGLHVFDGAGLEKPEAGTFIRGRIEAASGQAKRISVRYGIEAYFAPRKTSLDLEQQLRKGGVAVVMIAANGKAALKSVVAGPEMQSDKE